MKKAVAVFILICASGLFVAAASGVRWGTVPAGFIATVTLYLALAAGFLVHEAR